VNGDGIPDLVTENTSGSAGTGIVLTVQLGTGKGGFHAVSTITLPSSFVVGSTTVTTAGAGINSFAVGDLNGDGKADIALTVSGLGGFNGIGMPVQYSGSPIYFTVLSNGDGTFSAPVPHLLQIAPGGSNGYDNQGSIDGIKIADFNHDGHADLIVTYVDVFGSFSGTVASPFNQGFDVLLGNGDGTFQAGVTTTTYTGATAATVAFPAEVGAIQDLNGDGFSDLLVVNPTFSTTAGSGSQVEVFLGRGDGSFKAPAPVTTANNTVVPVFPVSPTAGLVVADFNKDGRVDLACLGESTSGQGQLAISLGNGDGTFAAPTLLNVPGGDTVRHSSLAAADFDGDGSVDLALFNAI
jgi:hypothetical protein